MRSVAVALGLLLLAAQSAAAQSLRMHSDDEGGTRALVPSHWRVDAESERRGSRFVSPDGSARLGLWASPDDGRSLRSYSRSIAAQGDIRITYEPVRSRWFVLSGYREGRIFYTKVLRACGRLHHVAIEYPAAGKRAFDPVVTQISRSLHANC